MCDEKGKDHQDRVKSERPYFMVYSLRLACVHFQ